MSSTEMLPTLPDDDEKKVVPSIIRELPMMRRLSLTKVKDTQSFNGWMYRTLTVDSGVNSVKFSPDNSIIVAGLQNCDIVVYDVFTGTLERTIKGHTDSILYVDFSTDGKFIVSSGREEVLRVFEVATGKETAGLTGHTKFGVVTVLPTDGSLVCTGSGNGDVVLWPFENGRCTSDAPPERLKGHTDWVQTVKFSDDGKYLVSGAEDYNVRVWDVEKRECIAVLVGHTDGIYDVTFINLKPDHVEVASAASDKTVKIWDVSSASLLCTLRGHSDRIWGLAHYENDGSDGKKRTSRLVSSSGDKKVIIWDVETRSMQATLSGHAGTVYKVDFSSDGRLLATCAQDKCVRIWDVQDRAAAGPSLQGHDGAVLCVDFGPDNTLASGSADGSVRLWDVWLGGTTHLQEDAHPGGVNAVFYSPDGKRICTGGEDGSVKVWSIATGDVEREMKKHTKGVADLDMSDDGLFLVSGGKDECVYVWELNTGVLVKTLPGHSEVTSVDFSPDNLELAVTAGGDCCVRLYDTQTWKEAQVLPADNWVFCATYSPSGDRLAVGDANRNVIIWDRTGSELRKTFVLGGHEDWVRSVRYAPDGLTLATACVRGHAVRVWDNTTGHLLAVVKEHTSVVNAVSYAGNGASLASASDDGTLHLVDMVVLRCRPSYSLAVQLTSEMLHSDPQEPSNGVQAAVRLVEWWMVHAPQVVNQRHPKTRATLLHWACRMRQPAILEALLKSSSFHVLPEDMNGNTPIDICLDQKAQRCLALLLAKVPSIPLADRWTIARPRTMSRMLLRYPQLVEGLLRDLALEPSHPIVTAPGLEVLKMKRGEALMVGHQLPYPTELWTKKYARERLREFLPYSLRLAEFKQSLCGAPVESTGQKKEEQSALLTTELTELESKDAQPTVTVVATIAELTSAQRTEELERLAYGLGHKLSVGGNDEDELALQNSIQRDIPELPVTAVSIGMPGAARAGWSAPGHTSLSKQPRSAQPRVSDSARGVVGTQIAGPLYIIVEKRMVSMIDTPVVKAVLDYKWQKFAFSLFLRELAVYLTLLLLFSLATLFPASIDNDTRLVLKLCCVPPALYFLRSVPRLLFAKGLYYMLDFWRTLNAAACTCVVIVGVMDLVGWSEIRQDQAEAVAALLLWLNVLGFCRAFQPMGIFVRMLISIMQNIVAFSAVLSLVFLGFCHAFYLLYRHLPGAGDDGGAGAQEEYSNWFVFMKLYHIMYGGFGDVTEFADLGEREALATVLFIMYSALVTLVMLNLLIALMGDIYARLAERVQAEWLLERARLILDLESMVDQTDPELFPLFLHFMIPKDDADEMRESS